MTSASRPRAPVLLPLGLQGRSSSTGRGESRVAQAPDLPCRCAPEPGSPESPACRSPSNTWVPTRPASSCTSWEDCHTASWHRWFSSKGSESLTSCRTTDKFQTKETSKTQGEPALLWEQGWEAAGKGLPPRRRRQKPGSNDRASAKMLVLSDHQSHSPGDNSQESGEKHALWQARVCRAHAPDAMRSHTSRVHTELLVKHT